ncbi:MAG: alcohol dehydrogenase catalytic domain-containing protein, partial [Vulcanimicrobiaceae bacterium]
MRAAVYAGRGGTEVVQLVDRPQPEPGPDDLLVRVAAAGLNRADVLERAGRYGPAPPSTEAVVPGLEYAGTVVAAGANVRGIATGDRVFGLVPGGAHAEYVAVPAGTASLVPTELELTAAAAIPEAFITADDALFARGAFGLGQTVVVHAVGSSVGLAAVGLAKLAGGVVIGTSRSPDKLARAAAHGMMHGIALDDAFPK